MARVGPEECCVLNGGGGAWAFEGLARELGDALWVEVSESPRRVNYLLLTEEEVAEGLGGAGSFVPYEAMVLAADKRELARVFATGGVPTPETRLVESWEAARGMARESAGQWCLKYPTGCGAAGHRMLEEGMVLPAEWPMPLVVQEFVRMEKPEVYRVYGAGGGLFGWVARRFPAGVRPSAWVAHARGARYEMAGRAPTAAMSAARLALEAVGLMESFGCVDLLRKADGEWVVLEVGTDGMFNHVDRDLGNPAMEREIRRRIAEAFWGRLGEWRPWGGGEWKPRSEVD